MHQGSIHSRRYPYHVGFLPHHNLFTRSSSTHTHSPTNPYSLPAILLVLSPPTQYSKLDEVITLDRDKLQISSGRSLHQMFIQSRSSEHAAILLAASYFFFFCLLCITHCRAELHRCPPAFSSELLDY